MDLEQSKINISETWQKKTSGHNEFYLISQMEANNAVHKSYCLIQHDKIALFTYTKDDHDENERWNKNIAVESIIGSFGFVSEESRVDVVHQYRYNNFIKGVAASQKLIHQGINNGCFFESVVLLLAQIDAMIRIAIVFDRRLKGLDEQFETSLLYSDKTAPQKSFEEIVNEATTRGIIETTLRDEIETALRKKSILDRFIITSTSLFDVQKYAYSLFGISGKVNEVVKMLEQQLSDAGLSAFIHPDTEEFYKYYIKSKLGDAERK